MLQVFILIVKAFREWVKGHYGIRIQFVFLYLICYLNCVHQDVGVVRKDISHFSLSLEPFLPGIAHSLGIIQISSGIETDQVIMCFRIIHIHKVHIIGCHTFHAMLFPQLKQGPVHINLVVKYKFI